MPKPGDSPEKAKTALLGSWEAATFPTWTFWGRTAVHVYNTGNTPVTVSFQAGAAQPAYVFLDAGEDHREYGFWAGFPVTVTNATQRDDAQQQLPQIETWVW
ncbi:hypothetical protein ABT040_35730 [Streptomyces sp. NPDC002688]|uniref:hypothetical protein n=1 Tax=Streptomyces sp. NPDC002688 TaxID=3154423 RepID=UPI00332805A3